MDDFDSMPATEMMARRATCEEAVAHALGRFLFAYSRFVTALHLGVAWADGGVGLGEHALRADGMSVSTLLHAVRGQVKKKASGSSAGGTRYAAWLARADELRKTRNDIAHARWGIEAFGRHAIAVTTPILVEPPKHRHFTVTQIEALSAECTALVDELAALRRAFPL